MSDHGPYKIREVLTHALERKATDIHLKEGSPIAFRVDGALRPTKSALLEADDMTAYLREILTPDEFATLQSAGEIDVAAAFEGIGRFRVNCYKQRGHWAVVMRHVRSKIPSFQELNLPERALHKIAEIHNGLVLMAGSTSCGKSTTLAALIDRINHTRDAHIVTLEDPIEYVHTDQRCRISQREVGIDTKTFYTGLRAILREDPNVILIGELRDVDTFETCISAAESGHLVFSTLHTTNVMTTVDRLLDWFPANEHDHIRSQLAVHLKAVICQRLLPRATGEGRVPAVEIMFTNPAIAHLIHEGELETLPVAIAAGQEEGMQTFNMDLARLVKGGTVTLEVAEAYSDNPEELKMILQGIVISRSRGRILQTERDRNR